MKPKPEFVSFVVPSPEGASVRHYRIKLPLELMDHLVKQNVQEIALTIKFVRTSDCYFVASHWNASPESIPVIDYDDVLWF